MQHKLEINQPGPRRWSHTRARRRICTAAPLGSVSTLLGKDQGCQFCLFPLPSILARLQPRAPRCSINLNCKSPDDSGLVCFQPTELVLAPLHVHSKKYNLTQAVLVFVLFFFFLKGTNHCLFIRVESGRPKLSSHGLFICEIHGPRGRVSAAPSQGLVQGMDYGVRVSRAKGDDACGVCFLRGSSERA